MATWLEGSGGADWLLPWAPQQKTALPRVLPWFPELAARAASTEERDPTRALEVPFGMRAGIVTALAGVSDADDPSGMVRTSPAMAVALVHVLHLIAVS